MVSFQFQFTKLDLHPRKELLNFVGQNHTATNGRLVFFYVVLWDTSVLVLDQAVSHLSAQYSIESLELHSRVFL